MSKILTYVTSIGLVGASAIYAFRSSSQTKNAPKSFTYSPSEETIKKIREGKYERYDDVGFRPYSRVKDNLNNSNLRSWAKEKNHPYTGDALIYILDSWFYGMDMRSRSKSINDFESEIKSFITGGGAIDREFISKGQFLPDNLKSNSNGVD